VAAGGTVSDRITWTKCPACGAPAAVGWMTTAWENGEPVEEVPVELDCRGGCPITLEELRRSWNDPGGPGPDS
jgi:hypothetical protein